MRLPLVLLCLCLPLHAQDRLNSLSLGLGVHRDGFLITYAQTGRTFGGFLGWAIRPPQASTNTSGPSLGPDPVYTREAWGRHAFHGGFAWRLDSRVMLGVGLGSETRTYEYVLHPGANPWSMHMPDPGAAGSLSETSTGPVAMVDLRLGAAWGVQLVAGSTGAGASLTLRF